jgi:hypothetical protein
MYETEGTFSPFSINFFYFFIFIFIFPLFLIPLQGPSAENHPETRTVGVIDCFAAAQHPAVSESRIGEREREREKERARTTSAWNINLLRHFTLKTFFHRAQLVLREGGRAVFSIAETRPEKKLRKKISHSPLTDKSEEKG